MATKSIQHSSSIGFSSSLDRGDRGADVKQLQEKLVELGYMTQQQMDTGAGIFGPRTRAAVLAFQRDHGIEAIGVVGPKTRAALSTTTSGASAVSSLRRGDIGSDVKQLQTRLVQLGYMTQAQMNTGPGTFGPRTQAAVAAFQRAHGIEAIGVVGPKTQAALSGASRKPSPSVGSSASVASRPSVASKPSVNADPAAPQGKRYSARGTGYYPDSSPMEGGYVDRKGHKLYTLQAYLAGKAPYVSVAMDSKAFPYGTKLRIPELEKKYGRQIEFRVVDTGGAFKGKGTSRIDICTANQKASLDPTINGPLTLVFG